MFTDQNKFGRTMRKDKRRETEIKPASSSRFNGYENGIGRFRFDYSLLPGSSHQLRPQLHSAKQAGRRTRQLRCVPPDTTEIVGNDDDAVGHVSLLVVV